MPGPNSGNRNGTRMPSPWRGSRLNPAEWNPKPTMPKPNTNGVTGSIAGGLLRDAIERLTAPQQLGGRPWESGQMGQRTPSPTIPSHTGPTGPRRARNPERPERDIAEWFNSDRFRRMDENPLGHALAARTQENAQNAGNPELDALMAEILALTNQPDTPGQWISEYSQDYLNELGDRLTQQGLANQGAAGQAKEAIGANYQGALANRAAENADWSGTLSNNLANLGMSYGATDMGKRAQADAMALNEVAGQNQATDQSWFDKIGQMALMQGENLGMQAKEGLLTEKFWQPPQSGIDAGEEARLGFLTDQYNRLLDNQEYDRRFGMENDAAQTLMGLEENAKQEFNQTNPLFAEGLAQIQRDNPQLADAVRSAYNIAGGDIPKAIASVQERLDTPAMPTGIPSNFRDLVRSGIDRNVPMAGMFSNWFDRLSSRIPTDNITGPAKSRQSEIDEQLLEFLMSISDTYGLVPTRNTMSNTSNRAM